MARIVPWPSLRCYCFYVCNDFESLFPIAQWGEYFPGGGLVLPFQTVLIQSCKEVTPGSWPEVTDLPETYSILQVIASQVKRRPGKERAGDGVEFVFEISSMRSLKANHCC